MFARAHTHSHFEVPKYLSLIHISPEHDGMFQLAGWGTTENGTPSDVLLYANLPYVDHYSCISKVPQAFRHYVTTDKFCAGYTNGKVSSYFKFLFEILMLTNVQSFLTFILDTLMDLFHIGTGAAKGDSGGGLTFVQDDLHYVYGIVSTKAVSYTHLDVYKRQEPL